jgi:HPt (histidine-containing phosphotransfer) domain-containing protein
MDSGSLVFLVHTLKSSCGTFAAGTMASLCADLEVVGIDDAPRATAIVEELDREYDRVAVALRDAFRLDDS